MSNQETQQLSKFAFAKAEDSGSNDHSFDNHIEKSIKGYSVLWKNIVDASQYFVESNTNIYDLGASTGKLIHAIYDKNKTNAVNASYFGIDCEQDFTDNYVKKSPFVSLVHGDITKYNYDNASFVTSIFTLQFIPREYRLSVLKNIYQGMNEGAGLIIAEKTISEDAKIENIMNSLYYQFKRESFTAEEILDKEQKLRYLMKPMHDRELSEMLYEAGFEVQQKFWQSFNFVGYIAIKK